MPTSLLTQPIARRPARAASCSGPFVARMPRFVVERPAVGEVERLAVEIGDPSARFGDHDRPGRLVPDLFLVVGLTSARSAASSTSPAPAASTAYFAWLSSGTGAAVMPRCSARAGRFRRCSCGPFRRSGARGPLAASERFETCSCCHVAVARRAAATTCPARATATSSDPAPPGGRFAPSASSGQPSTPIVTTGRLDLAERDRILIAAQEALGAVDRIERPETSAGGSPLPRSISPQTSSGVASGTARRTKCVTWSSVSTPSSSRSASADSSPMSVEPGRLLGQPPSDDRLHGEVGHRHRRAVVLGERRRDQFPLHARGPAAPPRGPRRSQTQSRGSRTSRRSGFSLTEARQAEA